MFDVAQSAAVVLPLVAIVALAVVVVVSLYVEEGQLPVFDVGVLTILVTALYSAIPLLGFWLAGLQWTTLSYLPLYLWNPGPAEVGAFAWRHVVYLYSFTAAYLCFRGHAPVRCGPTRALPSTALAAIVIVGAALLGYFWLLDEIFGVSYDPSYNGLSAESIAASFAKVPHIVQQISHNLFAILFLLKLCALVWLMSRWQDWKWRTVLYVWLLAEGVTTVMRMGARTWFVLLLMAAGLLFHRLVKPLSVARAAILIVTLLGGALVYGVARDLGGGFTAVQRISHATSSRWATMNEFQALFGIAYDLHARQQAGLLGKIPWEIYASDITLLVPSQVLPFPKADPCVGYPIVDGVGLGCVLSVIAQAIIGFDWIELVVRGLGLGLLFAVIHRWYVRRQDGYWATMFYLCMCLWCYYTFRGSTFFFVYYIVYRFVPLVVGVRIAQLMVRRALRAADACGV